DREPELVHVEVECPVLVAHRDAGELDSSDHGRPSGWGETNCPNYTRERPRPRRASPRFPRVASPGTILADTIAAHDRDPPRRVRDRLPPAGPDRARPPGVGVRRLPVPLPPGGGGRRLGRAPVPPGDRGRHRAVPQRRSGGARPPPAPPTRRLLPRPPHGRPAPPRPPALAATQPQ